MSSITQDQVFALLQSDEAFPVDFDIAWKWLEYSRKDSAKDTLTNNFEQGLDYEINRLRFEPGSDNHSTLSAQEKAALTRKENIRLTIDCFKSMGMMAGTKKGREVRRYFLDCELQLKKLLSIEFDVQKLPSSDISKLLDLSKSKAWMKLKEETIDDEVDKLKKENEESLAKIESLKSNLASLELKLSRNSKMIKLLTRLKGNKEEFQYYKQMNSDSKEWMDYHEDNLNEIICNIIELIKQ